MLTYPTDHISTSELYDLDSNNSSGDRYHRVTTLSEKLYYKARIIEKLINTRDRCKGGEPTAGSY